MIIVRIKTHADIGMQDKIRERIQQQMKDGLIVHDDMVEIYHGPEECTDVEVNTVEEQPLLTIELQDETAVPKVFYEGEEITNKMRISFDWLTRGDLSNSGGTKFNIEHFDTDDKEAILKGVGLSRGKYAMSDNKTFRCENCDTPNPVGRD